MIPLREENDKMYETTFYFDDTRKILLIMEKKSHLVRVDINLTLDTTKKKKKRIHEKEGGHKHYPLEPKTRMIQKKKEERGEGDMKT